MITVHEALQGPPGGQCSDLLGGAATISLYSDIVRVNLRHKHKDGFVGSNMILAHTRNLGFLRIVPACLETG